MPEFIPRNPTQLPPTTFTGINRKFSQLLFQDFCQRFFHRNCYRKFIKIPTWFELWVSYLLPPDSAKDFIQHFVHVGYYLCNYFIQFSNNFSEKSPWILQNSISGFTPHSATQPVIPPIVSTNPSHVCQEIIWKNRKQISEQPYLRKLSKNFRKHSCRNLWSYFWRYEILKKS